jgi:hypothetical protein
MKLQYLCCVLLWCFVPSAVIADGDDFSSQLEKLGIPKDKIEALLKDDINSCKKVNKAKDADLKAAGLTTGQKIDVQDFCNPPLEFPKILMSCSTELDKKSELDLLNCLVADPKDTAVLQALQAKPSVQKASAKTLRWAAVNEDKKLDADVTHKYLTFLNKDTAAVQKVYQNKRTVAIEVALGMESGEWTHPLFEGKFITDGLDEFEVDWSSVPLDVMNALLWARTTGHKLFPKNLDGATALDIAQKAAVKPVSDAVWKKIVEDYKMALEEKDPSAIVVDVKKKP